MIQFHGGVSWRRPSPLSRAGCSASLLHRHQLLASFWCSRLPSQPTGAYGFVFHDLTPVMEGILLTSNNLPAHGSRQSYMDGSVSAWRTATTQGFLHPHPEPCLLRRVVLCLDLHPHFDGVRPPEHSWGRVQGKQIFLEILHVRKWLFSIFMLLDTLAWYTILGQKSRRFGILKALYPGVLVFRIVKSKAILMFVRNQRCDVACPTFGTLYDPLLSRVVNFHNDFPGHRCIFIYYSGDSRGHFKLVICDLLF